MANVRNGNTYFIDTASVGLEEKNQAVIFVVLTGVGGAAVLELGDNVSGASYPIKLSMAAASGKTEQLLIQDTPLVFPNGVYVKTATNCKATLFLRTTNGT